LDGNRENSACVPKERKLLFCGPLGAIIALNKIIWTSVGADLSALSGCDDVRMNKLKYIIGPYG